VDKPPLMAPHVVIDLSGGPAFVLELPSCEDVGLPSREGSDASVHSTQL